MTLKRETNLAAGVPQTSVPGFAPRGIAWHWTAGGKGRAGWDATVKFLIQSRYTTNASYHAGFWVEHKAGHEGCVTVVQWIVPTTRASHSMNPGTAFVPKTGSDTERARFADVHRILARDTDPNADSIALSYAGMPADLAADMKCEVFRKDLRALARTLEQRESVVKGPHFGHGWIQPSTRYEMDAPGVDFILNLAPVIAETREERLAAEVSDLREKFPEAAAYWAEATELPYEPREPRLAAEALYLRLVAIGGGRYR